MTALLADPITLFIYVIATFAAVFVWPTLRLRLSSGINALVLPQGDSGEAVVGRWFKGALVLLAAMSALAAFAPAPWDVIGPIALPFAEVRLYAGWAILAAALVWIAIAQVQMGRSWRIGVDPAKTELKAAGLFGVSRNPIFLGMRAMLVGVFLVAPNALSLAVLLLGEALMQLQVRFEEAHLDRVEGEAYRAYRARVPRWL
ncbi:MAG: isoprenylcysteine carboxylmethyltransferase family protein [Micropepsaceae bacterium]